MIRSLRIKLIAVSMLSLFLVLLAIIGTVNILNYLDILQDAEDTLTILAENQGRFPESYEDIEYPSDPLSPEVPYESRYFSVLVSYDGEILSTDTGRIAAIDEATAMEYARRVFESGKTGGFLSNYRFVTHSEGSDVRIIFLDCGRSLTTFRTFLLTSVSISLVGMLAVLLLLILFSGRLFRPVIESYEKQRQFITDAGHELKTPLAIIGADAEGLEMDIGESECLQDIRSQVTRLASLTNDLIYLSRMEEQQHQLQTIDLPFSELVEETARSFQTLAKTQGKEYSIRIHPMLSVRGDEKALRQLVSILLDNAVKYSPPGGNISLSLDRQGKSVRLLVENSVEQISADTLEHMFDRFYRADQSRNSQTGGYGTGLSVARAVVAAHRGKITAFSKNPDSISILAVFPSAIKGK